MTMNEDVFVTSMNEAANAFREAAKTMNALTEVLRKHPEADSWPVYVSEYGDVMCGQEGCGCEVEECIILTPFKDLTYPPYPPFTLSELFDAVEGHVATSKARRQEKEEEDVHEVR